MHVANQYPAYNPYAVCTSSVYLKQGKKRTKVVTCDERYTFEDFETNDLQGYARMKKIPGAANMNRDQLIKALYRHVASRKGRLIWQEYIKEVRKEHPELSFAQALKRASKEYHREKASLEAD